MDSWRFLRYPVTRIATLAWSGALACGGQVGDRSGDSGTPGPDAEGALLEDSGGAGGSDDATGTDANADVTQETDADADATEETSADADAASDADSDADASCVMTRVSDQPSRATVNFVLTNTSAEDRYVVTSGQYCKALVIGDLILSTQPWQEQCEGPPPFVSVSFTRIPAGASVTVPWDARQAVAYATNVDCSPVFGRPCTSTDMASLQPVAPGAYVATFEIAALPDGGSGHCTGGLDSFDCTTNQMGGWGGAFLDACPAGALGGTASSIMQSFTVPSSGIATVAVSVP